MQCFRNTQRMTQSTTYLRHHSPKTCQGIATTRSPSGPVDLIIIEERECVGAIRHQDGLEGVHLQDENGWVWGSHDSHSPPSRQSQLPSPSPLLTPKLPRAAARPLLLCLLSEYVLASSGKGKTCGVVDPGEKLPENYLQADSAPLLTSLSGTQRWYFPSQKGKSEAGSACDNPEYL